MFRKTVFWIHLVCGVLAGLVILMMSVTGVILTYERQILAWEDRVYFAEPEPGQQRLTIPELVSIAATEAGLEASSVSYHNDIASPAILSAGRSGTAYINPYTGRVYEPHSETLDNFFSTVTGWHRWFDLSGDQRGTGRMITGASNLAFLFLLLSGLYLWLPSVWRWSSMRLRLWFHPNAKSGKARDFNWHHIFGFWMAIPLIVVVTTATVFYYPWANNLVYRLAGEEPPQRGRGAAATAEPLPSVAAGRQLPLDELFNRAAAEAGDWKRLTMTLPDTAATVAFSIDQGNGGEPQKRHRLSLDSTTGEVTEWAPFSSQSTGRQARSWVRFLHTGEALGLIGQTLAGLASLAGVLLVWTGLSLALRRFARWRRRQQSTPGGVLTNEIGELAAQE